jgi:hypothetical protein
MGDAHFEVTNPKAPRYAVQGDVADIAARVAAAASARSPRRTGALAASFRTAPGYDDPGTTVVIVSSPYFHYLEYGTRHIRAYAMLGGAMAAGG